MKKYLYLSAILLVGCTRLHTTIKTIEKDGTSRETESSCISFFDSRSDLQKFKTTNTDKTQSLGIGVLGQESSGTNAVRVLDNVARIVEAAAKLQ